MGRYLVLLLVTILLNSLKAASQLHFKAKADSSAYLLPRISMPQKFYNQTPGLTIPKPGHATGFFCRKELQLQKALRMPLFIRLGSKSYVDWMERKLNATGKD